MPDKSFDPIPTRHSLLSRLKDLGDETSWQDFFDTYSQLIYNVAVKAGLTDAEAQEVVQETIIAVARKIGEFKRTSGGSAVKCPACPGPAGRLPYFPTTPALPARSSAFQTRPESRSTPCCRTNGRNM